MLKNIGKKIKSWVSPIKSSEVAAATVEEIPKVVEKLDDDPVVERKKVLRKPRRRNFYKYYTARDKLYFKTSQGRKHIDITASEALKIIRECKAGKSIHDIYLMNSWTHDITEYTVYNWVKLYNLGLMDIALDWICHNCIADVPARREDYLHRFVGDI